MNIDNIIAALPKDWNEYKFCHFKQILDLKINEDDNDPFAPLDNKIGQLSVLTGLSKDILESLSQRDVTRMMSKIAFTDSEPDISKYKCPIQWKSIDGITYDEFISYLKLSVEPLKNLHDIIKMFSVNNFTDDEINNLSVMDIHAGFFLLNKFLKKFFRTTYRKTAIQLNKLLIKEKITTPIKTKLKNLRKRFISSSDGISPQRK